MSKLQGDQIAKIEDQIVLAVDTGVVRKGQNPRIMLAGAMTTLEALGYDVPPIWSIWIMSGRDVYAEIKKSRQPKAEAPAAE